MSIIQGTVRPGRYEIGRSLRFSNARTTTLSRVTPAGGTDYKKGCISLWVKRSQLSNGNYMHLIASDWNTPAYRQSGIRFNTDDTLSFVFQQQTSVGGSWVSTIHLQTSRLFRDTSAWVHIFAAWDTSQAVASNRASLWINGFKETSFTTATYPVLNENAPFENSGYTTTIGDMLAGGKGVYSQGVTFDGYMADIYRIDGQSLGPSSFGEFSAETGEWVPKQYAGAFGTLGYFLPFRNGSSVAALGYDLAGAATPYSFSDTFDTFNQTDWVTTQGYAGAGATAGVSSGRISAVSFGSAPANNNTGPIVTKSFALPLVDFDLTFSGVYFGDIASDIDSMVVRAKSSGGATIAGWLFSDGWNDAASDNLVSYYLNAEGTNVKQVNTPTFSGDVRFVRSNGVLSFYVGGVLQATASSSTPVAAIEISFQNYSGYNAPSMWVEGVSISGTTAGLNTFTVNNHSLTAGVNYDWMLDTPSNNHLTLNCLDHYRTVFSNGNLTWNQTGGSGGSQCYSTAIPNGLRYWECYMTTVATTNMYMGLGKCSTLNRPVYGTTIYINASGTLTVAAGNGTAIANGFAFTSGDTLQFAFDRANGKLWFGKNGAWSNSGDPSNGLNANVTGIPTSVDYGASADQNIVAGVVSTGSFNFGQQPFAYQVPAGFQPLNSKTQITTTTRNEKHFSVKTYVGNGGNLQVGEVQKAIDLVTINQSLRFRSGGSSHLRRSPTATGNRQKFTFSTWVKRSAMGTYYALLGCEGVTGSDYMGIRFTDTDTLQWFEQGGQTGIVSTVETYRNPSVWMHVLCIFDSANATQADRQQIWVNGVRATLSGANVAQNFVSVFNVAGYGHVIGAQMAGPSGAGIGAYYHGYMADVHLIDGQVVLPTNFGQFDANGYWVPKTYTGAYGTNGYRLTFSDNSGTTATTLGKDSSGNSNNWTPNNFNLVAGPTYDWMLDTPTNSFATLDPLLNAGTTVAPYMDFGNLFMTDSSSTGAWKVVGATIAPSAVGKVFFEFKVYQSIANSFGTYLNLLNVLPNLTSLTDAQIAANGTPSLYWNGGSNLIAGPGSITVGTVAGGDYLQFAIDYDNGYMWVGRNGVWLTGNPATGVSPTSTFTPRGRTSTAPITLHTFSNNVSPGVAGGSINFGQQPFAYSVPAGFLTLCENNVVENGYDVETPDLVFIKSRSNNSTGWTWVDRVRGVSAYLDSTSTGAQITDVETVKAFNKNGFYLGKAPRVNTLNENYVAYTMKMGGAPVANAAGSIASQVSANTMAGMSVVTYTGTGAVATVGHGLGNVPKMIIVRAYAAASATVVYHASNGTDNALQLQNTNAVAAFPAMWNNTAPTSSVFTVGTDGTVNTSGALQVAYCFAEVPGFSKFGSYTGNGSADGPFINCGFKPAFVMIKRVDAAQQWYVWDSVRDTLNPANLILRLDSGTAETSYAGLDLDSNGFKVRGTDVGWNTSGGTYIYWAMGSVPQQFANAR